MSENTVSIYKAISSAMSDISPIAKEKRNKEQGFQYRGIDDVMNELNPILAKHRIFIYPEVINKERGERQTKSGGTLIYSILTIKYHFATEDGSEICTTVIGEGMDSGDKASNKAMAVAFKYACLQMFCIPTDDMPDPDAGTPPPSTPKPGNPPPPKEKTERQNIIDSMGKVLKTIDANNKPLFTEQEIDKERALIHPGNSTSELKKRLALLQQELDKRLHAFENDIPWEDPQKEIPTY